MKFDINDYHRNIQNEDLLKDVIKISERTEKNTLTQAEYKKEGGRFSKNTFLRHFGSWNEVLRLCGLEVNQWQLAAAKGNKNYHDIKTEELIADLKNVAIQLNKESMSSKEYEEHGKYSKETYFKRFHTWDHALQAAGLKPFVQVSSQRIDDKELLKEIERVWVNLGRQPTSTDIKKELQSILYTRIVNILADGEALWKHLLFIQMGIQVMIIMLTMIIAIQIYIIVIMR